MAAGEAELTADCQAFRGVLGTKVMICKPADPEAQGPARAGPRLPGALVPARAHLHRPGGLQRQLQGWLDRGERGGPGGSLGCPDRPRSTPTGRDADVAAGAPATGWRCSLRLPRDYYVRLDSNDYSVHPAVIGRRIEVVADLDRVRAFCEGRLVADHERIWARHQTITDPEHRRAADGAPRTARTGPPPARSEPQVEPLPGRLRRRARSTSTVTDGIA